MLTVRISHHFAVLCVFTFLTANSCDFAQAQTQGHWRGDQYIGFVPKHLQQQSPEALRRAATTYQSLQHYTQSEHRKRKPSRPTANQPASIAQTQYEEVVSEGVTLDALSGEAIFADQGYCGGCDACVGTCGPNRMWARIEFLNWDAKGFDVPSLATRSDDGTLQDDAGVLPAATTLFGGERLNDRSRSGARVGFGMWLNPASGKAIEFTYAFLENEAERFSASVADGTILARPFFNIDLDAEDARLIVFPDVIDGTLDIDVETEFHTAEVLFRNSVVNTHLAQIAWTLGYRYANLNDRISIAENTTALSGIAQDSTFDLTESFETDNHFHGGQLGLKIVETPLPRWSLEMGAKFAFGRTLSETTIAGETTTTTPTGDVSTNAGGLLAQASNIGTQDDTVSSTMTELNVALRHRLPRGLIASVGYTALYWSDLGRAGTAIDQSVNPTQIPPDTLTGAARPEYTFTPRDFWARGINFGLECNF